MYRSIQTLLRNDITRLALVAALGAAVVLGFQAVSKGGDRARRPLSPASSPSGVSGAAAGVSAGRAGAAGSTGKSAAPSGAAAAGGGGAVAANTPALPLVATPGPRMTVVVDEPTGPFSQQNKLIRQGATVALDVLNAHGGIGHHRVQLVTAQLDGLSPAAVQARLAAAGKGAVLVLPCDTNSQSALATGASAYNTLMLAPCDGDASLAGKIPTYWPVGTPGNAEAAGLAAIVKRYGAGSIFVVGTHELSFADSMSRYITAASGANGLKVDGNETVSLSLGDAELARVASAIKAARPQPAFVFTALPPPYVNALAAGLARNGVHRFVLGTTAMDTPLTRSAPGAHALENALFGSYGFLGDTPAARDFLRAYRARYGTPDGSFPGLGYETVHLLEAAVSKARSSDPAAIQRALRSGVDVPGAALFGRSYSAGNHNPSGPVSIEKYFAGTFLPVLTSTPTGVPSP